MNVQNNLKFKWINTFWHPNSGSFLLIFKHVYILEVSSVSLKVVADLLVNCLFYNLKIEKEIEILCAFDIYNFAKNKWKSLLSLNENEHDAIIS